MKGHAAVISVLVISIAALMGMPIQMVCADDTRTMITQLNKDLRQAQKDMFAGKSEKAIAALEPIKEALINLKRVDPNNPGIKGAERKYQKLVKDLERRTGKDLGGGTLTAAGASTKTKLPPKPKADPMPAKTAPAPLPRGEDPLVKEAHHMLRTAEKSMFDGKNREATQHLVEAEVLIQKIEETDPENPKLGALKTKYGQLQKLLKAKMPTAPTAPEKGSQQQAASHKKSQEPAPEKGSQQQTAAQKAGKDTKLPYAARKPFQDATRQISRVDDYINRLSDPNYGGDKNQLLKNMDRTLENARKRLDDAKAKSAEKGVTSHPRLDQAEADLAAAAKRAAAARSGHQEAQAAASAKSQAVEKNVKALTAEYNRLRSVFDRATGFVIHYNDLKPVKALLDRITEFETKELEELKAKMAAFSKTYGTTREEIDKKAESMGYSGQNRASFAYTEMVKGIANIKKTRTVMADDLVRKAANMKEQSKRIHDFSRVKQHARVKAWAQMAANFDPDNPRVTEFMSGLDAWISEDLKDLNAKIDKVTWAKHEGNAPKDAEQLASAVFGFLEKECEKLTAKDKIPRKMLAVVITGPWVVFKKNILAEPIQYGLPILGAVQLENERSLNLARVYQLTMLTEERKGVKTAPPFVGSAVGNSYYIRPSAVR
jgi:hypothetical protein